MPSKNKKKTKASLLQASAGINLANRRAHPQSLDEWELDVLGIPLEVGVPFPELNEPQRILFQRCCELYRITEHFKRKRELMLNVFSEYRTRSHFESALRTHYFETDEGYSALFDPEFYAVILGAYHFIRSLSLSLTHTESLPTILAQELIWADANLVKTWNRIAEMAGSKFAWKFKKL